MKRRDFLDLLIKKQHSFPDNPPSTKGIQPYSGPWTFAEAGHLLRRTTFGPTLSQINQVETQGLAVTLTQLLEALPLPNPPINYDYLQGVPLGSSWVDKPLNPLDKNKHLGARRRSFGAWNRAQITAAGIHLREKMTLFWHNHFATRKVNSPESAFRHAQLLRKNAFGNIRQFVKEMTIDAKMLVFLNGNQNVKNSPNENYARELLELFTVGKGPLIAPGDYSIYTEQDVTEGAKILTGWKVLNRNSTDANKLLEVVFQAVAHTEGSKSLSTHFGNTSIDENGAEEYKDFIDVIFSKPTVAQLIVKKLYRFFVYYDITDTVQQKVIDPLAQLLIDNDYEIKPVLETLFSSEHFYDELSRGCLMKTPIDFIEFAYKQLHWPIPADIFDRYALDVKFVNMQKKLGMIYYNPPSVAGWKAYYQSPTYQRNWINSVTFQNRNALIDRFVGNGLKANQTFYKVDYISLVQEVSIPSDPDSVVLELTSTLLPFPPNSTLHDYLKGVLLQNLPDFEWTEEYNSHLNEPTNESIIISLENKIKKFLKAILELPEYHLC